MKIAVTGATGLVGRFVLRRLVDDGHDVHALTRQSTVPGGFEEISHRIRWFVGDMTRIESLNDLIQDCGSIVHAGFQHIPGRYRGGEGDDPIDFWRQNFLSTLQIVELARSAGLDRVVLVSSRAVFDGVTGSNERISDGAIRRPKSHYGLLKSTSEHLSSIYDDIVVCSLRSTGIYGLTWPIEHSKWWGLVERVMNGSVDSPSNSGRTEVHGNSVSDAVARLLTSDLQTVNVREFNCSDTVVSDLLLTRLVQNCLDSDSDISLANLPTPENPENVMSTGALQSLGWKPLGLMPVVQTVRDIINAIRSRPIRRKSRSNG